jgi:hypothetical protein
VKKKFAITISVVVVVLAAAGATLGVLTAYAGEQSGLHPCGKLNVHSMGVPDPGGASRIQRLARCGH